jgi:hypothetical protein
MKTQHQLGLRCVYALWDERRNQNTVITGVITGRVPCNDNQYGYRVNMKTDDGIDVLNCHPDCISIARFRRSREKHIEMDGYIQDGPTGHGDICMSDADPGL